MLCAGIFGGADQGVQRRRRSRDMMTSMTSDIELLEAWRAGHADAGEKLFERYYDCIYRFFRHKLEGDVADLVQQTFFALLEGIDRVHSAASFRSYLFGIAHNLFRGHLRQRYRNGRAIDFNEVSIQALAPGPNTMYAKREELRLLVDALRMIPLAHQVLLELRYWEQLKTAEIADVLDIPHPTVRSRLRRAHELLEKAIARLADSSQSHQQSFVSLQAWAQDCREQLNEL